MPHLTTPSPAGESSHAGGALPEKGGPMRVAVLGASGFVGAHVVDALRDRGHEVLAVVKPGAARPAPRDGVEVVRLDPVGCPESVDGLLAREPDGVINAAGRTIGSRTQLVSANALLVAALLDALKGIPRPRRPRLVQVGTAAEYDAPHGRTPVPPRHPTEPRTAYGISKLAGSKLVVEALRVGDVTGTVVRMFTPIGPGSPAGILAGAAERRLREAYEQGADEIRFGALDAARDFIDIRDAAELFVRACEHRGDLPEVMNAGTGVALPAWNVVLSLTRAAGWDGRVTTARGRTSRATLPWQAADISTTRAALDWRPRRTVEESMQDQWAAALRADGSPLAAAASS